MHTAFKMRSDDFAIASGGTAMVREALLDWGSHDRLGVVVSQPFGATGAGLLTQLVATAFFDAPGTNRRRAPVYPDMHIIHAGGPWGNHWAFDFWPDYKEAFVAPDREAILAAVNSRGITHLLVPDAAISTAPYRYKAREEALMRLKAAFAYCVSGQVRGGDVHISTRAPAAIADFRRTLHPREFVPIAEREIETDRLRRAGTAAGDDARYGIERARVRSAEVAVDDPVRLMAVDRLADAEQCGEMCETLRRIAPGDAVGMLGEPPFPPAERGGQKKAEPE